jgi:very-short-patch-repair endonuclease
MRCKHQSTSSEIEKVHMSTDAKPKGKARKPPAYFTSEFQRWARKHVSSKACSINGAKGFSATVKKYGPDVAFNGARQWRLDHPSNNELLMIGVLSALKIAFEREWRIAGTLYAVDFYLPKTRQTIEVHSRIHEQFDAEKRRRQDACKRKLLKKSGIECLTVWDRELVRDVDGVIQKVRRFVRSKAK